MRLVLLFQFLAFSWAAEALPVPSDQRWVVTIDMAHIMAGRVGRWVDRLADRSDIKPKLALFTTVTGTDPRKDISRAVISGRDARPETSIIALAGRIDREKLETLVSASDRYEVKPYRSYTVHSWQKAGETVQRQFGSIVANKSVLVAGSNERLQANLDTIGGFTPAFDPGKAPAPVLPNGAVILVDARIVGVDAWQGLAPEAAMLRLINAATVILAEGEGRLLMRARMTASGAKEAKQLGKVVEGYINLSMLDPKSRTDPAWMAVLQSAQVTVSDQSIDLAVDLPLDLAERHWSDRIGQPAAGP